jgi:hypothetical protein
MYLIIERNCKSVSLLPATQLVYCNLCYGAQWVKTPHFSSDVYQPQSANNEEIDILEFFFFDALSSHCIEIDFFTPIYIAIVSQVTYLSKSPHSDTYV